MNRGCHYFILFLPEFNFTDSGTHVNFVRKNLVTQNARNWKRCLAQTPTVDSNMESALAMFHVSSVVCSLSGSWQGNEGCSPALISDPSNTCSSWPEV